MLPFDQVRYQRRPIAENALRQRKILFPGEETQLMLEISADRCIVFIVGLIDHNYGKYRGPTELRIGGSRERYASDYLRDYGDTIGKLIQRQSDSNEFYFGNGVLGNCNSIEDNHNFLAFVSILMPLFTELTHQNGHVFCIEAVRRKVCKTN